MRKEGKRGAGPREWLLMGRDVIKRRELMRAIGNQKQSRQGIMGGGSSAAAYSPEKGIKKRAFEAHG